MAQLVEQLLVASPCSVLCVPALGSTATLRREGGRDSVFPSGSGESSPELKWLALGTLAKREDDDEVSGTLVN